MKLPSRMLDISVALDNETVLDPPFMRPKIDYKTGKENAWTLLDAFPGLKSEDLPDGEAWAVEFVHLATHNGTHMDAPYHYQSKSIDGERMITIDEVPLDWFFRPGVKLDFRGLPDGHIVTAAEVEAELKRIGHELKPFDIIYRPAAAWAANQRSILRRAVCASAASTPGAGTRPSCTRASAGKRRTIPRSSGKATKPAGRFPIATWRSCATSISCRPMASLSLASRPRSKPRPAAGRAPWRCSIEGVAPEVRGEGAPRRTAARSSPPVIPAKAGIQFLRNHNGGR
jgi:hypothetical protein